MGVVKRGSLKGLNWLHMLSEASKAGFTIPPCTPSPTFFCSSPPPAVLSQQTWWHRRRLVIYDKSTMAGLNHCEEKGGNTRGGGPPILLKLWAQCGAHHSQLVVLGGIFFKGWSEERKEGWDGAAPSQFVQSRTCTRTHTYTHKLEPMGGEERSHIRAQPCLIMDLMETVSAESVSTCAAPDSSQLFFFFFMCIQYSHTYTPPPLWHTHPVLHPFVCINICLHMQEHAPTHTQM